MSKVTSIEELQIQKRHSAIIRLDREWARKELKQGMGVTDASNYELAMALHKARFRLKTAPKELRIESGQWLIDHGVEVDLENLP